MRVTVGYLDIRQNNRYTQCGYGFLLLDADESP